MPSLSAPAPVANANPFPPITRADLARAAMWKLKLPDAPLAVEAVEPPAENPRDSWPNWTDEDIWNATGDDDLQVGPADRPEASDLDLTGFATKAGDALAADDEAACGPVMEWVDEPRGLVEAEGPRPEAIESYTPTRWEDDRAAALFARPSRQHRRPAYSGTGITDEDLYRTGCAS